MEIEHQGAQKALQESEERYRSFFQTSRDAVFITSKDGQWIDMNTAAVELFGYESKEELQKVRIPELYAHPDDRREHIRAIEEQGFMKDYPVDLRKEDGSTIHALITSVPVKDNEGNTMGYQGTIRDISERKRREEQARFQSRLLDAVGQAVIATDPEGIIIYWNQTAERLYGWPEREILGHDVTEVIPTAASQERAAEIMTHLRAGKSWSGEFPVQRQDGSTFPAIVTDTPVHDADGNLTAIIGVTTDITERKHVEEELRQHQDHLENLVEERTADLSERMQEIERLNMAMTNLLEVQRIANCRLRETAEELERANEELESFAYVVSHDLKAPLRGISQLTEWLAQDCANALDQEGKEMLELLTERTHHMQHLIDNILAYSRVGRVHEKEQVVETQELVQEIVEMLSPPEKIDIIVDGPLPTLRGAPPRLRQLFQNLIGNAVKFVDKSTGRIEITCTDRGQLWQFAVADNGPGIDKKHQHKIFEIFQTPTSRDQGGGTGIGLAITKRIVESYGGKIWVDSTVGEGSTFYFTLPKANQTNTYAG